jgi:hypothetical protein
VAGSRFEGSNLAIGIVALVATIVGSAAAVVALVGHDSGVPESGSAISPPAASAPAASASAATAPTGTPTADLLSRLTPTIGGTRLTKLPDTLRDNANYADSVAIACASNQSGDKASEVSYESRSRYRALSATLEAYRSPAEGVRMQLFVYLDPASRDFGIDEQKSAGQIQLTAGQSKAFSTDVKGAYYVRLRLVCEKPGGLMILRQGKLAAT